MAKQNSHEEIIQRFEKMIITGKNYFFDLNEFLEIIDHYIFIGNYTLAWKAIHKADKQYQGNFDIDLFKAEILALENKYDEALDLLEILQERVKDNVEVYLLEADIYSRTNQHHKAIKTLQKALKINKKDTEILDLLTIEFLYLDDYENALKASLLSLKYDPENQAALYNAVSCYDYLNLIDQSIKFLENYVNRMPMSEIGWSLLAKKYIEQKEYIKALKALDFAIAIDDKFLGAYYDKAHVLTHLGNYSEAIKYYKITLGISDPTPFAFYHIAKNYEMDGQNEQAIQFYQKAIHEDPGHYKSWLSLINILEKEGKIKEALKNSEKAIRTAPTQELYEKYAKLLFQVDKIDETIKALEMSLKMGVLKIPTVLMLADLYKLKGEKEKFRSLLLEARKQYPDSKEIQNKMSGN